MSVELNETLVVGISATALFDLSRSDKNFSEKSTLDHDAAIDEYRKEMLEKENDPLDDGTGMPLVKSLLKLNKHLPPDDDTPIVEVVVISRNSPETGIKILKEIRRRQLPITRSAFIAGEQSTMYLEAFYVDLFLTTNQQDAQIVTDSNVCAAALVKAPPKNAKPLDEKQVRFAFDADAVLFNEESEIINKQQGLEKFKIHENENQDIPLSKGPYANLLKKLSKIKERLPSRIESSPIKLAIMTARNSPAEMRVLKTLRAWDIYIDQAFFLGGLEKSRFLKAFNPHIFFDDQDPHLEPAAIDIPCAKVLYPSNSPLNRLK
ncbi:MAG: 5'-nucleotidase [Psychromonas sp.]|nr:5'-nucleotidase [Psychromonas sp.]